MKVTWYTVECKIIPCCSLIDLQVPSQNQLMLDFRKRKIESNDNHRAKLLLRLW